MAENRNLGSILFVLLVGVAFLISGIVTASHNPGTQQGHLIPPHSVAVDQI
jgi:hypothetical protein